jgi:hypothetical protein
MRCPRIVDLRNVYDAERVEACGFAYESVGRPTRAPGRPR